MSVLYSSGQLAQKAHVSKKTLRYYDEHNILKPSYVTTSGARRYNDDDLAKLQQILLLKFLGFALDDIREIIVNKDDRNCLKDSLFLQKKFIEDRIEQFQVIAESLQNTAERLEEQQIVDWNNILELIYMLGMEKSLKNQYQNASNISSRINLHNKYARNTQGWFPWIFEQCGIEGETDILEIGCGDGTFWISNREKIPLETRILVSDISAGMLSDARRSIGQNDSRFQYQVIDCHNLPFSDESFDLVIANHVLFYCEDIPRVCKEVARVLNPGGMFVCSTYGEKHMVEITDLVREFDDRIILSANRLYERFGKSNGKEILSKVFSELAWKSYDDELIVTKSEPLISYILSCHGNQNQYILDRYMKFRHFVRKKINNGFHITKDAGIFQCRKEIL